jgi:uncharacterized membrane protein
MHNKINYKSETVQSLKAQSHRHSTLSNRIADCITELVGSMWFLSLNILSFVFWIILNSNFIPGLTAFDPFPFEMLTTIVSLEAIILSIAVLISQNNAAKIADMREEIDLHINTIAEREITKVMELVIDIAKKNNIKVEEDPELETMLKPLSRAKIERSIEKQLE